MDQTTGRKTSGGLRRPRARVLDRIPRGCQPTPPRISHRTLPELPCSLRTHFRHGTRIVRTSVLAHLRSSFDCTQGRSSYGIVHLSRLTIPRANSNVAAMNQCLSILCPGFVSDSIVAPPSTRPGNSGPGAGNRKPETGGRGTVSPSMHGAITTARTQATNAARRRNPNAIRSHLGSPGARCRPRPIAPVQLPHHSLHRHRHGQDRSVAGRLQRQQQPAVDRCGNGDRRVQVRQFQRLAEQTAIIGQRVNAIRV